MCSTPPPRRLAVKRGSSFEAQGRRSPRAARERAPPCPIRTARAPWIGRRRHIGLHHLEHLEEVTVGEQVVSATRPPLRVTRATSAAAASGRLANITPHVEMTASNSPSAKASFSASPMRYSILRPSALARSRARRPDRPRCRRQQRWPPLGDGTRGQPVPVARSRMRSARLRDRAVARNARSNRQYPG